MTEEIVRLEKLFVDEHNKEIFFAVILKTQSSLIIGKCNFARYHTQSNERDVPL